MSAVLAPVPAIHLQDVETLCSAQGRVAFGYSYNKDEFFKGIMPGTTVYIFPTRTGAEKDKGDPAGLLFSQACFVAIFDKVTKADDQGNHPNPDIRPISTITPVAGKPDGPAHAFWEVTSVKRLPGKYVLGKFKHLTSGKPMFLPLRSAAWVMDIPPV